MTILPAFGGVTDPIFAPVREVFQANFQQDAPFPELGAAVSVNVEGRCVVDLWGGIADAASGRPWGPDTLVNVWSTTKGVMALVVAALVDEGLLSYDEPVARYWPEFAVAGKTTATVGEVLSHQVGLNGFEEPTTVADFGDWDLVTRRLALQAPVWSPGSDTSYHAMTFGFLAGEIARRVTGKMPRDLIADLIARPLKLDLQLGAAPQDWSRVAPLVPPPDPTESVEMDPIALRAVINPALSGDVANRPEWRAAQIPAGNGHATARSLSRLWGAVANDGHISDVRLLSSAAIAKLQTVRSERPDRLLGAGSWGAGVMINREGLFGPGPRAFGHCGWGGSFGYADPELGVGVGYTPNRMFGSVLHDPRGVALGNVIAECAGRAGG